MSMAWQLWKKATPSRKLLLATCSLFLAAIFLSGAHALDFTVPYLPLAIAGGFVFYLRVSPKRVETLIWLLLSVLLDRKSTRLNSSHANISYAVFCLKKNAMRKSHPTASSRPAPIVYPPMAPITA